MARIRSIKPDFWSSESLGTRLPGADGRQARLLFIALWNHAEDHGVCRAAPALLKAAAFVYDDDVTPADVSRWLGMLEAGGFIVRYSRNGSSYAWIRSFDEHQKIDRKSKTTLPEPSLDEIEKRSSALRVVDQDPGTIRESSTGNGEQESGNGFPDSSTRRVCSEDSLQEGKGREGKGVEDLAGSADAAPPVAQQASLLTAEPPKAAKQRKQPEPKPEPKGDQRHHPLKLRVMEIFREVTGHPYGFGGIDAKALSGLLALADQNPSTAGDAAPAEIERRWRIGLAWIWGNGEKPVQNLSALHKRWNDCATSRSVASVTTSGGAIPAHLMRRAETHRDALLALPEGEIPIPD